MTKTKRPDVVLFLDDHRGIYIPRDFAQSVKRECVEGVSDDDWEILEDPEHESYWDAWSDVLDNAIVVELHDSLSKDNPAHKETRYRLHQDGALWLIPEGMDYDERTDSYFWSSPMEIRLSQSDDDNGMVTVYCEDQRQARLDRSICIEGQSSNWEIPRDMDCAYTSLMDEPDLVAALTAAGYEVDDSEYSPPDDEDLAYWRYRFECDQAGEIVMTRETWLALR